MNCSARCLGDRLELSANHAFSLNSQGPIEDLSQWFFEYAARRLIFYLKVKTRLAQVWCKGPTCRKSLAAFGRKCVQLHCKVRILLHRWQTPNRVAQELSWQGADCETSKAGDQVAHLAYSNLPPSSIQRPDLVSNIIRAHCVGTSPGGSTQPQQTTVILI